MAEKKGKKSDGRKGKKREKIEKRSFSVSLVPVYNMPKPKRANRAITLIKRFIKKHFRVGPENVKISQKLNELVWSKGREHVPRRIGITAVKAANKVNVYTQEEKIERHEAKKPERKVEKKSAAEEEAEEEQKRTLEEKKTREKAVAAAEIKRK